MTDEKEMQKNKFKFDEYKKDHKRKPKITNNK